MSVWRFFLVSFNFVGGCGLQPYPKEPCESVLVMPGPGDSGRLRDPDREPGWEFGRERDRESALEKRTGVLL